MLCCCNSCEEALSCSTQSLCSHYGKCADLGQSDLCTMRMVVGLAYMLQLLFEKVNLPATVARLAGNFKTKCSQNVLLCLQQNSN